MFWGVLNKTIILLAVIECEIIPANSDLRASSHIQHALVESLSHAEIGKAVGNNPRPSGDTIYYRRINTYLNETSHRNCSFEGFTCVLPLHDSIQGRQRVI